MKQNSYLVPALFSIAITLLSFGCAKQELEVSYLYVPGFEVAASATSGDISTQITDVRVVIGPQTLGFYPLPARIPILASGEQTIRLEPVVRIAGEASNRIVYPMYEVFEELLTLVPGTVDTIRPIIDYVTSSNFAYVEDFETSVPSLPLDLDDFPQTTFQTSSENVSTGSGSGRVTLTAAASVCEVATPVLNNSGATWNRIWLEMDFYRGDAPVAIGLLPEIPGPAETRIFRYFQGGNSRQPGDDGRWVKLYFELVDNGLDEFATRPFRIGFLAVLPDTASTSTADVFIDNLKVVYQN